MDTIFKSATHQRNMGETQKMTLLSIVIPCYNEESVISETLKRLIENCDRLPEFISYELLLVNDGSSDKTLHQIKPFLNSPTVKLLNFSRNFGHQLAVSAGIDHARGDAVVLIDADLQDPPEVVLKMVEKWQEGYDVVYGRRTLRKGETSFKRYSAKMFYRLLNRYSSVPIPLDTGDFRLMSRKVVNVIKDMPESDRFIRGMVSWAGFRQTALPYERAERFAGETKYPLRKMLRFATDGLLSFSTTPLQIAMGFGLICSALSLAGILLVVVLRLFTDTWVEGWTAIMVAVLFLGGVQLISIGILGEYVGRIYVQTKKRPNYVVDRETSVNVFD